MKYLMLVCVGELPADVEIDDVEPWVAEMTDRRIRLTGDRLRSASDATMVRTRDDQVLVTDGPFAETKDQIAGFDILDCADLDEAIEVAAKHPMAKVGTLELRPFWE